MRQIISTAVVAVVVGAVAGATMGAVAQSGPETPAQQAIVPAVTSINAHKVDGRHAVSASASRKKRRGKLVATNRQGYLPANIIKPAWSLIQGMPPAFADGMDNEGVTGLKIQRVWGDTTSILDNTSKSLDITCPAGTYVISGGFDKGASLLYAVYESYALNGTTWRISMKNEVGSAVTASAFAMCLSIGPGTGIDVAQKGLRPSGNGPRK